MLSQLTSTGGHQQSNPPDVAKLRNNHQQNGNESTIKNHYNNNNIIIANNNNSTITSSNNISNHSTSSALNKININNNNNYNTNINNTNNKKLCSNGISNGNIKNGLPLKTANNNDETDFVNNKTIILNNKKDINERHLKPVKVTEINENLMQNGLSNYKQLENDANRLNSYYNKLNGCYKSKTVITNNNNLDKNNGHIMNGDHDESVIKTNGIQSPGRTTNGYRNGYSPMHQPNGNAIINNNAFISNERRSLDQNRILNKNGLSSPNSIVNGGSPSHLTRYSQNGIGLKQATSIPQSRYSHTGLTRSESYQNGEKINDSNVTPRYGRCQSVIDNKMINNDSNHNEIILNGVSHNLVRQCDRNQSSSIPIQNGTAVNGLNANNTTINSNQNGFGKNLMKNGENIDSLNQTSLIYQNNLSTENLSNGNGTDCPNNTNGLDVAEKNKLAGRFANNALRCVFYFNIYIALFFEGDYFL